MEVGDRLDALAAAQVGVDGVALDGAGPDDGHLDDQVVERLGRLLGSVCICARDSIWKTPTVSAAWIMRKTSGMSSGRRSRSTQHAAVGLDVAQRIVDGGEHAQAEQVELDQLHRLDVALVVLDDDAAGHRGALERRDVDQRRRGDEHAADVDRRWRGKPSMRAHSSSQRSHGDRPTVLPPRGCAGGSGSTRATLEWLGASASLPRPIACVGGAGGSQAYGRPRRSVRRSGRQQARPSRGRSPGRRCVPRRGRWPDVDRRLPARRSQRTLAGESPGPPSSSEGLGRSVVTGASRSGESTSGSGTTDRPPTVRGRMSPMGSGPPCPPRRGPGPSIPAAAGPHLRRRPARPALRRRRPPSPVHPARRARGRAGPCRRPGHARRRPRRPRRCPAAAPGRRSRAPPPALEELGEAALRLQVAPDHDRVVGLERLGHPVDQRPREAQRVAHLAHRRARPVGDQVADHARVLRAVALVDVLDDLLAAATRRSRCRRPGRRSGPR